LAALLRSKTAQLSHKKNRRHTVAAENKMRLITKNVPVMANELFVGCIANSRIKA
jgi:hypothetical protein